MNITIENFFKAYFNSIEKYTVYTNFTPIEMMNSSIDEDGWFNWKPIQGNIHYKSYADIMNQYHVVFPESFIEWHKAFFFIAEIAQ